MKEPSPLLEMEPLSERELTILRLLSDGLTNREIADHLFLSHETVKWYNKQIYSKLDVKNRTQAGTRAREYGLLDGDLLAVSEPPPAVQGNLPAQLSTFVGRQDQIEELSQLLRGKRARLVTLTGPGGIGKTRLALETARNLSQDYSGGTWLVDLATIRQPDRVADAIASCLGLEIPSNAAASETLASYLRDRELLLIADNFEHLLEAGLLLADLLARAANLGIVVTSREPLKVYGEMEYLVPPLSLPETAKSVAVREPSAYESVELFVHRAQAVRPGFRLNEGNVQSVSEICLRLDGLPLAIELAAARIKFLSPYDLRDRISKTLSDLRSGRRDVPDRQRTLEATVNWSYELLNPGEKELFAGVSIFQGGFTLRAIEAMMSFDGTEAVDDGLESLLDKSLLVRDIQTGSAYRFRMLQTISDYAYQRLVDSGNIDTYKRRHAEHFADLAEHAALYLRGQEQAYWFSRLDVEYENIRAALGWALDAGEISILARLVAALRDFWYYQGPSIDGLRWMDEALPYVTNASPSLRARALMSIGHSLLHHGDNERGSALLMEALSSFRESNDQSNTGWTTLFASYALLGRPDKYEEALEMCEEGIELLANLDDSAGVAQGFTIKGELARTHGDLELAEEAYMAGLELARNTGDRRREIIQFINLGMVEQDRGNSRQSITYLTKSLILAREIHFTQMIATILAVCAGPFSGLQEPEKAATMLGASAALLQKLAVVPQSSDQLAIDRYEAEIKKMLSSAAYEKAYNTGWNMSMEQAVAYALTGQ